MVSSQKHGKAWTKRWNLDYKKVYGNRMAWKKARRNCATIITVKQNCKWKEYIEQLFRKITINRKEIEVEDSYITKKEIIIKAIQKQKLAVEKVMIEYSDY